MNPKSNVMIINNGISRWMKMAQDKNEKLNLIWFNFIRVQCG